MKLATNNWKVNQPVYDAGEVYKTYYDTYSVFTDVIWDNLSAGITADGSALTATSLAPSYANGASFDTPLIGDFTVEFKITMGTYSYIGLDKAIGVITAFDAGPPISGIDFSFRVDAASIALTNDGVSFGAAVVSNSDTLKFVRTSGTIELYRNDVLIYTYSATYTGPLYMKANRYSGSMTNYIYDTQFKIDF